MKQKSGITRALSTLAIGLFGAAAPALEQQALLERYQDRNRPGGHAHRRQQAG
jgi:hypothetical protein